MSLYWGEAQLISLGTQSDQFLATLNQLYGTALPPSRMNPQVDFAAVGLNGSPQALDVEPVQMKLFFEAEDDELCAEFYLNCDRQKQTVEFHEKDSDYRRAIVLALGQS